MKEKQYLYSTNLYLYSVKMKHSPSHLLRSIRRMRPDSCFRNQIFFTLMGNWPSHNPQPGQRGVALGLASTPRPGRLVEPARGLSPNRYSSQGHRNTQAPPPPSPPPPPPPPQQGGNSRGRANRSTREHFQNLLSQEGVLLHPPPPTQHTPIPPPLSLSLSHLSEITDYSLQPWNCWTMKRLEQRKKLKLSKQF